MEITDEQIVKKVQDGDIEAYSEIVDRYHNKLERYGRSLLFNTRDLEDILQEIFIKAYQNIKSFDTERRFSPWIYRIAHNEFINHGKKNSRSLIDYFDLEVFLPYYPSTQNVHKEIEKLELSEEVSKVLEKIPDKYREPLILYFFEELSYQEIADVLHLPINTVGIRILRGKEKLKLLLANN